MTSLRILLVDPHTLVRRGIRTLLEATSDFEVVGEAPTLQDALKCAKESSPDIVLFEMALPHTNGSDPIAKLAKAAPRSRLLVLTAETGEASLHRAIQAGVAGYVSKTVEPEELVEIIRTVAQGNTFFPPTPGAQLNPQPGVKAKRRSQDEMTPRQRQVLQLLSAGWPTRDIAKRLTISVKTVETHRSLLMDRLGIYDVPGLVRYAIRVGLITADL
jgi:DNA-binding NarL/FixJ family response regulator